MSTFARPKSVKIRTYKKNIIYFPRFFVLSMQAVVKTCTSEASGGKKKEFWNVRQPHRFSSAEFVESVTVIFRRQEALLSFARVLINCVNFFAHQ